MSGWYPDPGGAAGRFRYWDGSAWSADTTADPQHTPPPRPGDGASPNRPGGNKGWIVALVVLAIVTAVVIAAVLWGTGGVQFNQPAQEDTNSSTPTVSAWDETSSPTTPPPPPTNSGGQLVSCPVTQQVGNTPQRAGQLTADTLSVSWISGWTIDSMHLDPVYDLHAQVDQVYFDWMSNIAVGLLSNADGFVDISTSAELIMECFASSGYYIGFTGREDIIPGQQISISGHPAWHIQSNIYVNGYPVPGDVVDIIVVDLGTDKDHLGLFFSSCSIGDAARCALVESAISTLSVSG